MSCLKCMAFALMLGGCSGGRALTYATVSPTTGQATAKGEAARFGGVVHATNCGAERTLVTSGRTPNDETAYTIHLGTDSIRSLEGTALRCEDLSVGDAVDVRGAVGQNGEVEATSVELVRPSEQDGNGEGGGNRTSPGF
jgi:hypothetical protein